MPVSLRDSLPDDDLAWFVVDAVAQMDLGPICARHREDGWGAAAYQPVLMVALLLYAYATGERSSRRIEACCRRDIAYRVICANQVPDHATIARFRAEHEVALSSLFGGVLRLCAAAGPGRLGRVALDGTKIAADVSSGAERKADALDAQIGRMLEEAAVDAAEDAALGDHRGDELPPALADRRSRLARFTEARRQLAVAERAWTDPAPPRPVTTGDPEVDRPVHRRRRPCRPGWSARNTTDPDSRKMRGKAGWLVGYNAQVVVSEDGIIIADGLTQTANDVGQLAPMLEAVRSNVEQTGFRERIGTLLADAGYWSEANFALEQRSGPRLLIAPDNGGPRRAGSSRPRPPGRARMRRRLARPATAAIYRRRAVIVEPVFGHLKEGRGFRRFQRRGFAACSSEWSLACTTHDLLKLWRHTHRSRPGVPPPSPSGTSSRRDRQTQPMLRDRQTHRC